MFSTVDIISAIQQALSPFGLRIDNVVDAYAVYWMSAWHASMGSTDTPSRIQAIKVKQQALQILIAVPEIAQATDAQKQEFAEALLIQTALIDASMEQAAGNPDQLRAIASAVRQGARATGLDLDSMTLTSNGFIPTTQGSSVQDGDFPKLQDDTPVEKDVASSKKEDDSNSSDALIAAAGGAGLGGMLLLGKADGQEALDQPASAVPQSASKSASLTGMRMSGPDCTLAEHRFDWLSPPATLKSAPVAQMRIASPPVDLAELLSNIGQRLPAESLVAARMLSKRPFSLRTSIYDGADAANSGANAGLSAPVFTNGVSLLT